MTKYAGVQKVVTTKPPGKDRSRVGGRKRHGQRRKG